DFWFGDDSPGIRVDCCFITRPNGVLGDPHSIKMNVLIPVLVYAALALLTNVAGSRRAQLKDGLIIFPILLSCRILVWAGGLLCAVLGLQEIYTRGFSPLGMFFAAISIGTLLFPMQSVAVTAEGIESIPVLFRKRVIIPWGKVQKVEQRDSWGWTMVHGNDSCITFTRFNADRKTFERLLRLRVNPHLWTK
ncbi:MAG TPA: hypothetical protein VF742_03805, partial [Terracidiphilus sp.]